MLSRKRRSWGAVTLATLTTMVLTSIGIPAASAAEPYVAPMPPGFNPCGTVDDRIENPGDFYHPTYGFGGYYIDGVPASAGVISMAGKSVVTVTTDYDSGTWSYTFTDDPCGAPAPNVYSVSLGSCDAASHETAVFATITNTADAYGQSLDVYVDAERRQDGWDTGASDAALQIRDGETRTVPVRGVMDIGLLPGDFDVIFLAPGLTTVLATRSQTVPSCGGVNAPQYEDPDGTGTGGSGNAKPKGSLRQVRGTTKMQVKMVNKRVVQKTTFTVTINKPGRGGKTVKTFKVKSNAVKKLKRPFVAPVGTTFVLRAITTVSKPDGTVGTKKYRITGNKIRPSTSG